MPIGPVSLVLIILAGLLIFGPSKLPELGKALGRTMREFKNATRGLADDEDPQAKKPNSDQQ